ncbi:cytokine-inducible SH2-containing protein-like [Stigmatopora nigra]
MVAPPAGTTTHRGSQGPSCPLLPQTSWDRDEDLACIATNFHHLNNSGWYWGTISASQARDKLLTKSEGTFLVRESSHPHYMVALSVMTHCGPTSVRIQYSRGCFWLDSFSPQLPHLQSFPDVISLVQRYTTWGQAASIEGAVLSHKKPTHIQAPLVKDNGVILKLLRPLHRPETFPCLQHLARLAINRFTNCPDQLPLPKALLNYLHDYPFHI